MEQNLEEGIQIIEAGVEVFQAQERAAIDSQIATARQFPRNLRKVLENSIVIVTMDQETAKACRYAKPVGGKTINGPSVHLARIICQQYGNIRVQQRIKSIDNKTIVAEAVAFDLETNYAVCVEARRSILKKDGRRYEESTIETNAMAIMAIAERNAVLKVIPKTIIDKVYSEANAFAFGDLSDRTKFLKARNSVFNKLKNDFGISEIDAVRIAGVNTKEAVNADHVINLSGIAQSLKDKEITIEELLKTNKTPEQKKVDLKIKNQSAPEMP